MASRKTGFNFYNIDTDRYQDIKIKRLKKTQGCCGIAVYDYILCEIYRVKGCFLAWDEHTAFDVSDYFDLKETTVNEIVNYCCSVGLFDKALFTSGRVLTSKSIQVRYLDMCNRAKRKDVKIPEEYDIITEESPILPEESTHNSGSSTQSRVEYSKVKKSKEEKSTKTFSFRKSLCDLGLEKSLVDDFLKNRKLKRLANTETALKNLVIEFNKNEIPIHELMTTIVSNGWGSFKNSWLENQKSFAKKEQKKSAHQILMERNGISST